MSKVLLGYPIDGISVCNSLRNSAELDEQWVVRSIETLTSKNSTRLGDLWRRSKDANVSVSTRELCDALSDADQVITLDVHLSLNESMELLIEDGLAVIDKLK